MKEGDQALLESLAGDAEAEVQVASAAMAARRNSVKPGRR